MKAAFHLAPCMPVLGLGLLFLTAFGCGSAPGNPAAGPPPPPNLAVADSANNRVLIFEGPFSTGQSAGVVLGQADFTSTVQATTASGLSVPVNVMADPEGNLWVSDVENNRVVRFASPYANGMTADLVLGQSNFTGNGESTSQSGLSLPHGLAFDKNGNLWVADSYNSRVLEFEPPFTSGMNSSLVLGQSDFTGRLCSATPSGLCFPTNVVFDATGNLWVADSNNNRVLRYNPPFSTGQAATAVLGQPSFGSSAQAFGAAGLYLPGGMSFDAGGNLWVADQGNWRVMEFATPFSNGEAASIVLGFSDFTSRVNTNPQSNMTNPIGLVFDGDGDLLVADSGGHRVLLFSPPFTDGMDAAKEIGEPAFGAIVGGTSASTLSNPIGICITH